MVVEDGYRWSVRRVDSEVAFPMWEKVLLVLKYPTL
jgi:hypothetical protein